MLPFPAPQYITTFEEDPALNAAEVVETRSAVAAAAREKIEGDMITRLDNIKN
jgi:hypothetical protein